MNRYLHLVLVLLVMFVGSCSVQGQRTTSSAQRSGNPAEETPKGDGEWVTVDGQRVFVPAYLIDRRTPRRHPEVLAKYILKGREIIKRGEAKTTFTPSRSGTEMLADSLEWDLDDPQTLPEQIDYIRKRVDTFNQIMRESRAPTNDAASGAGVAMLIAEKVLTDNHADLTKIERWRESYRTGLLGWDHYQGKPDDEKQFGYEYGALFAVESMDLWKQATVATQKDERERLRTKAREYARIVVNIFTEDSTKSLTKNH